jgi:hypothetical protein
MSKKCCSLGHSLEIRAMERSLVIALALALALDHGLAHG